MSTDSQEIETTEEDEFLSVYLSEVSEITQNLEASIIDLEAQAGNPEKINEIFRMFHNIKGSSGMMSFTSMQSVAHYTESLLDQVRSGKKKLHSSHVDLFLESITAIKSLLSCVKETKSEGDEKYFLLLHKLTQAISEGDRQGETHSEVDPDTPTSSSEKKSANQHEEDQIKVSRSVIEQMMLLVSDFMLIKNRIQHIQKGYPKDMALLDSCQEMNQFSTKLQKNVLKLRLSPVNSAFTPMRRVVRTTANLLKKKIDFDVDGKDTLLDREILDVLGDPLMHLIRNSIDHGIEAQHIREERNKPATGKVSLSASYRSGEVHISVKDDGGGIDPEKMKRIAVSKQLITPTQAANLSNQDAMQLIFTPGFSGAEVITETSGRGVGMDVVKSTLDDIGGQIEIQSEVGVGTTFVLKLPLSLAIIECLGFQLGAQSYGIPQMNVEEVLSSHSTGVQTQLRIIEGSRFLMVRDAPIPIIDTPALLEQPCKTEALILVRQGQQRFILEVGSITGPISIVSQPLPRLFAESSPYAGITKQGDGGLLFQLDVTKLSKMIQNKATRQKRGSENRGVAGTSQEYSLMTSSDIRRLQQKTITFKNGEYFAVPVQRAKRIVFITNQNIHEVTPKGKSYVTIDGETIPLVWVEEIVLKKPRIEQKNYSLLIFNHNNQSFGLPISEFIGIERMPENYETVIAAPGVLGSTVINTHTHLCLDLPDLVQVMLGEKTRDQVAIESSAEVQGKWKRVLCAEDDRFFATELAATLKGLGLKVDMAIDGLIAKNMLMDESYAKSLDAIITDIEMPNMTGVALTRWIRTIPHLQNIPIIAYTAITTQEMKRKILSVGANAFVSKMALEELAKVINRLEQNKTMDDHDIDMSASDNHSQRIVTFQMGHNWFALPMGSIKEVTPCSLNGHIPRNTKWLNKVTSFRGKMIPVLDLHSFFSLSGPPPQFEQAVIEYEDSAFSLKVNRIGEVLLLSQMHTGEGLAKVSEKELKMAPYVKGVYSFEGKIITLFDVQALNHIVTDRNYIKSIEENAA